MPIIGRHPERHFRADAFSAIHHAYALGATHLLRGAWTYVTILDAT